MTNADFEVSLTLLERRAAGQFESPQVGGGECAPDGHYSPPVDLANANTRHATRLLQDRRRPRTLRERRTGRCRRRETQSATHLADQMLTRSRYFAGDVAGLGRVIPSFFIFA